MRVLKAFVLAATITGTMSLGMAGQWEKHITVGKVIVTVKGRNAVQIYEKVTEYPHLPLPISNTSWKLVKSVNPGESVKLDICGDIRFTCKAPFASASDMPAGSHEEFPAGGWAMMFRTLGSGDSTWVSVRIAK